MFKSVLSDPGGFDKYPAPDLPPQKTPDTDPTVKKTQIRIRPLKYDLESPNFDQLRFALFFDTKVNN